MISFSWEQVVVSCTQGQPGASLTTSRGTCRSCSQRTPILQTSFLTPFKFPARTILHRSGVLRGLLSLSTPRLQKNSSTANLHHSFGLCSYIWTGHCSSPCVRQVLCSSTRVFALVPLSLCAMCSATIV